MPHDNDKRRPKRSLSAKTALAINAHSSARNTAVFGAWKSPSFLLWSSQEDRSTRICAFFSSARLKTQPLFCETKFLVPQNKRSSTRCELQSRRNENPRQNAGNKKP